MVLPTHTHACTCTHTHTHTHMHARMHTHTHTHKHTQAHTHTHAHTECSCSYDVHANCCLFSFSSVVLYYNPPASALWSSGAHSLLPTFCCVGHVAPAYLPPSPVAGLRNHRWFIYQSCVSTCYMYWPC